MSFTVVSRKARSRFGSSSGTPAPRRSHHLVHIRSHLRQFLSMDLIIGHTYTKTPHHSGHTGTKSMMIAPIEQLEHLDHPLIGVRTRRHYLGFTADTMAKRLGISRTSYLRLERGERRIYFDKALAIAQILGCTCEQLTRMPTPDEVRELYITSQSRNITPVDDETGEILAPPADLAADNQIKPGDTVVFAGAHTIVEHTSSHTDSASLAAALEGWEDGE